MKLPEETLMFQSSMKNTELGYKDKTLNLKINCNICKKIYLKLNLLKSKKFTLNIQSLNMITKKIMQKNGRLTSILKQTTAI